MDTEWSDKFFHSRVSIFRVRLSSPRVLYFEGDKVPLNIRVLMIQVPRLGVKVVPFLFLFTGVKKDP